MSFLKLTNLHREETHENKNVYDKLPVTGYAACFESETLSILLFGLNIPVAILTKVAIRAAIKAMIHAAATHAAILAADLLMMKAASA